MRALATWSGAIAGLLLILVGSLIPAAVLVPVAELPPRLLSLVVKMKSEAFKILYALL